MIRLGLARYCGFATWVFGSFFDLGILVVRMIWCLVCRYAVGLGECFEVLQMLRVWCFGRGFLGLGFWALVFGVWGFGDLGLRGVGCGLCMLRVWVSDLAVLRLWWVCWF